MATNSNRSGRSMPHNQSPPTGLALSHCVGPVVALCGILAVLTAIPLRADETTDSPKAEQPATLTVTGYLRDASLNKPIQGAKVTIQQLDTPSSDGKVLRQLETQSDADGKYEFTLSTEHPWTPPPIRAPNGRSVALNSLPPEVQQQILNAAPQDRQAIFRRALENVTTTEVAQQPTLPFRIEVRHPDYATRSVLDSIAVDKTAFSPTATGSLRARLLASRQAAAEFGWQPVDSDSSPRQLKTLELLPGKQVSGILQSPDAKPIAGMKIAAHSQLPKFQREVMTQARNNDPSSESYATPTDSIDETITDAKGHFSVSMVTPGEGLLYIFPEKDFAPLFDAVYDRRGDLGIITLERGAKISGRLLDQDAKPLVHVQVTAAPWNLVEPAKYSGNTADQRLYRSAFTDEQGNFTLQPLPAGQYRLEPKEHYTYDKTDENERPISTRHPLPGIFLPQKLTLTEGHDQSAIEFRALPTVSIQGHIELPPNLATTTQLVFQSPIWSRRLAIQGTLNGLDYRVPVIPNDQGDFTVDVPRGLTDTEIDLDAPIGRGGRGGFSARQTQPQWRLGKEGPLQDTTKINLGTLNKDFTDLQIVYTSAAGRAGDTGGFGGGFGGRRAAAVAPAGGAGGQAARRPVQQPGAKAAGAADDDASQ